MNVNDTSIAGGSPASFASGLGVIPTTITLEQVGKRFQKHRVFKDVNFTFSAPGRYAILGSNGSGKSTLLRILAGMQAPSAGKVRMTLNGKDIQANELFPHVSYCAPGMELVEELTLHEFLEFHFSFKQPLMGLSITDIIAITGLQHAANKQIGDYSSGMKQRVKLAQAIFSDTPLLLIDEPCSNLDQKGMEQYRDWIDSYAGNRLIVVASNDPREYYFCREQLEIEAYK